MILSAIIICQTWWRLCSDVLLFLSSLCIFPSAAVCDILNFPLGIKESYLSLSLFSYFEPLKIGDYTLKRLLQYIYTSDTS